MKKNLISVFICLAFVNLFCQNEKPQSDDAELRAAAKKLSKKLLIVDTHIDLPYSLNKKAYDVSGRADQGHFDYARAREGGLDAAFMSIYIPAAFEEEKGKSKKHAENLIEIVEGLEKEHPDKFIVVSSTGEIRQNFPSQKIMLPMGMENGSPLEGDLNNLKYFYDKGIRYITLCHTKNNHICDSSGEPDKKWNGLSPFGEEVIKEMNRLGIMVDISHVSDSAFYDVIRLTKAPVIASHSACRIFTPGFERNMTDDMIKALAENGGVIQIYFGTTLVNDSLRIAYDERSEKLSKYLKERANVDRDSLRKQFYSENPLGLGSIQDVVKHIDHVVKLVGVNHVGFGSDYDGVGALPEELKDASTYPNLIYELLKLGYSEEDIEKICSGNIMRVWGEVEEISQK